MDSALYHKSRRLSKSTKMDEDSDSNNVQYNCDLETILSSKRKSCRRFQSYTNCQKPSFRDRMMIKNVKTIFITAILFLSLVHGISGQSTTKSRIPEDKDQSNLDSTKSTDSLTTTGINLIWEPSSDEANPSSITIIKITPTLPPSISITPTSSTSQRKETLISSMFLGGGEKFSKESSSSEAFVSSSTIKSAKKTIEKKIEEPMIDSKEEPEVITNKVTSDDENDERNGNIESKFLKSSKLLQEPDSNKIRQLDSANPSALSISSRTTNEITTLKMKDLEETSSDGLQIPSLSSSSSSASESGSSLEPTPLDLPTSWSSTNTQAETTMPMMTSSSDNMQTSTRDENTIKLIPTETTTISSNAQSSFLVHKVSREQQSFVRPENLPRSANGGAKIVETPNLSVEEENSKFSFNQIKSKKDRNSKTDPSTLRKSNRQSDVNLSDSGSTSGSLNDILTGLLNVVGEGLSIATNYVKANQKKQASQDLAASKLSASLDFKKGVTQSKLGSNIAPSRINNRGPPRFTEIPFEAIPLEVLSSQTPGQKPIVQIQQRPFQTRVRFPKPSAVNKRKPPVYATGIPLPQLLIPASDLKRPVNAPTTKLPASIIQSHMSNSIPQKEMINKNNIFPVAPSNVNSDKNKNKNGPIPGSRPEKFPESLNKLQFGNIVGEFDKEHVSNVKKISALSTNTKGQVNVAIIPSKSRVPIPIMITTTPKVQNNSYRPPTTFGIANQSPRPINRPQKPSGMNIQNQNNRNQSPNLSTTNAPNMSFGTRRTPPLVSPGFQLRPTKRPIQINTTTKNAFKDIVTGRPGPRPGFAARPAKDQNVFDVTVLAEQNYGGNNYNNQNSNIPYGYPSGQNIITQARPGNEFVSIDGKRTYFDIGPTRVPQQQGGFIRQQHPQNAFNNNKINGNNINQNNGLGNLQPHHPNALNTIRPPDLTQPIVSHQQGLSHMTEDTGLGSARPVEVIVGVDLNTGHANSNSELLKPVQQPIVHRGSSFDHKIKSGPTIRPSASPVRIDTCIVGDDSTCEKEKHEVCKTKLGVSSCFCRPGYGRKNHRHKCKKIVRLLMSMQVDRINQRRLFWSGKYVNPNSKEYKTLEGESNYAIDSAMILTTLRSVYLSNEINKFFPMNGKVTVNATLSLLENSYTKSLVVKRDVQKELIEVIQGRNSNIGRGNLYVDGPLNPIPGVADLNECADPEMHDCPIEPTSDKRGREMGGSRCINRFGGFSCRCLPGWGDPFADDPERVGRYCQTCDAVEHCSGRGICRFATSSVDGEILNEKDDQNIRCECKGNFYGNHCEIDGEVMAVAVGASVAAVIIIILTLICLCMWSRRWKRDQQKAEIIRNFPPHSIGAYGGGTLPLAPHPGLGGGSFLSAYVDGSNFNKAAIIASQAAAIQRAASIAGSRNGSLVGGNGSGMINRAYNNSAALSPPLNSQPPLPQVPPPPSSALEVERMRWAANQVHSFNENLKQNVYAKPDGHSMRKSIDHQMRYHDNRKSDLLGIQSSSTIKNGVFTNPQTKSNFNKRSRAKNKSPTTNHFGEEYPLSIRSFSTNKNKISSKALAHSKRKSSIKYLNKQSLDDRHGAFQDDIQIREKTKNYLNTNLQRSPSKRQIPDFISEGGSDINPRRLTPSSGETFMDSNSEDGEDLHTQHIEIKGSNSFYNKRLEGNAINWTKHEKRVDRTNSRHSLQKHDDKTRSRRRRNENGLLRENFGHINDAYYGD